MTEYSVGSQSYIEINDVDVSDYVFNYSFSTGIDDSIDEVRMLCSKNITDVLNLGNSQTITIQRGKTTGEEYYLFRGNISTWSPKPDSFEIVAKDKMWTLQRIEVTDIWNDKISDIATSLIETHGGLSSDVDDSGSGTTFEYFVSDHNNIYERLQTLRKILNWSLKYNPNTDKVEFKNKGSTVHPYVLRHDNEGTSTTFSSIKWDWDIKSIVNDVTILGGPVLEWTKETFSGTGSTDTFTLNLVPEIVEVENPVGTRKSQGVLLGSTTGYDYYVKKKDKQIVFVTNTTSGSNNVVVNYARYVPVTSQQEDEESIDSYSLSQETYYYPDILTVPDAEIKTNEILDRFKSPTPKATSVEIPQQPSPIRPGDNILVVDTINVPNINSLLTVNRITYNYPEIFDVIDVGQETIQDRQTITEIEDRIAKIEKREFQNSEFVNIIKRLEVNVRFKAELKVATIDTTKDGSWGKGFSNGTIGTLDWKGTSAVWQDDYTESEVEEVITHSDNQYEEDFVDDDYVDTVNTTATVNTTTHAVTF